MKNPKKPTRNQKILISSYRLQPSNWLVMSEDKHKLEIIHRHTDTRRTLNKEEVLK